MGKITGFLEFEREKVHKEPVEHRLPVGYNMAHFIYQFLRGHPTLKATLERGLKFYQRAAERLNQAGGSILPGEEAFDLYETYGFPLEMTSELAQEGGLGVIHKNLPIAEQASEVDRVKRSESGMIVNPITLSPTNRIYEALELMKKYRISGVPITEDGSKEGRLVGILTNRDLRFETNVHRPISEVMTREPLFTVPVGTTLDEAREFLHKHKVEKLLVVDKDYRLKGLITVKDIQKNIKYPNASKDAMGRLRVGAAVGEGPAVLVGTGVLKDDGTPWPGVRLRIGFVRAGEQCTAFLGAGNQGELALVGGGDLPKAMNGFEHRWEVRVGVRDARTDRIVLDVAWQRLSEAVSGQQAGVTLREDEEHVIDMVAAPPGSASLAANALVRVSASLSTLSAQRPPLYEYELWLVHEVPGREPLIEQVTAAARSGEVLPYRFRPLCWALSGEPLDERPTSSLQLNVGGKVRARMREDGTLEVELVTTRDYSFREGGTGGGGTKTFSIRPGETVAVHLPAESGGVVTGRAVGAPSAGTWAAGVTAVPAGARVSLAEFFAHHRSTVLLTVREVG